jgi:hypothetical protein
MLPVIQGERLEKTKCPYVYRCLSPIERRICLRSGTPSSLFTTPFHPNSNRIVRERRGDGRSGSIERSMDNWRNPEPVHFGWRQWEMRGGIVWITNLENNQGQGTAFTPRRYIAGFDSNTEDEIYDDDEEFSDIWDIPIWVRVPELINLRT